MHDCNCHTSSATFNLWYCMNLLFPTYITYFVYVVARARPVIILFTRLEAGTLVTVVDVKVQQRICSKYLVDVKRAKTTQRLVTEENFLMTS